MGNHSCALDINGNATWGRSDSLQTIVPTGRYTAIAAGRAHTCGINLQKVVCWDNSAGQSMPPETGTGVPVDTGLTDTGWGW